MGTSIDGIENKMKSAPGDCRGRISFASNLSHPPTLPIRLCVLSYLFCICSAKITPGAVVCLECELEGDITIGIVLKLSTAVN